MLTFQRLRHLSAPHLRRLHPLFCTGTSRVPCGARAEIPPTEHGPRITDHALPSAACGDSFQPPTFNL